MLESILVKKQVKTKTKITIKTLISAGLIAMAVILPQIVHLVAGAQGGMVWLPVYLPILIGGALLGVKWGLGVAIVSPILSFLITSAISSPMPALSSLPFMIAELCVFALVSGMFSKAISKRTWMVIPAMLSAIVAGRLSFLALVAIFDSVSSLSVGLVYDQILMSWPGIILSLVLVPLIIFILNKLLNKESK